MGGVFFDSQDSKLVRMVNTYLGREVVRASHEEHHVPALMFHPNGLRELGARKAFRVAWAVIGLLDATAAATPAERLDALRTLQAEACSSARSPLRLNTARVLVQLMKELLRARGNTSDQLRLAHDFNKAASGKPRIIRALLHRYNLLEMPEEWNQRTFDYHVHDANSSGRKSPTHLIMDAWLKGIRTLKVIYENYAPPVAVQELLAAAGIMGMTIRIGIRFRRYFRGQRVMLVWTPRGFSGAQRFLEFLDQPPMLALIEEGKAITLQEYDRFSKLVGLYNREYRLVINQRFGLSVPELSLAELDANIGAGQPSWAHLADCIHRRTVAAMREYWQNAAKSKTETRAQIEEKRRAMEQFSPAIILDEWLNAAIIASEPVIDDLPALLKRLSTIATDYRASIDTREISPSHVLQLLHLCKGQITHLELFKLRTYRSEQLPHLMAMNDLRGVINSKNPSLFKRQVLACLDQTPVDAEEERACLRDALQAMSRLLNHYGAHPLSTFVSSDSSGRSDWGGQYGMGFVIIETLPVREQRALRQQTAKKPLPLRYSLNEVIERNFDRAIEKSAAVARFPALVWMISLWYRLVSLFRPDKREWVVPLESLVVTPRGNVMALGGSGYFPGNRLEGDETVAKSRPRWHPGYLNTVLTNIAFVLAGFIPAFLTFQYTQSGSFLAFWGAPLWFAITGGRNILQAVMAGGGLRRYSYLTWKDYVSWTRISESLFYTGLSVPLLELGVRYLLLDKAFGLTTSDNSLLVFLVMAIVNGFYIMGHNLYRGLPTAAAYANMGRSIAAVPVAMAYNIILFWILYLFKVDNPAIILAAATALVSKTASDTAAAVIEGYFDRRATFVLRLRDFQDVLLNLRNCQATLELLFPQEDGLELLRHPEQLVGSRRPEVLQVAEEITVHCLDILYFHFYQPLAAQTLLKFAKKLQPEEKIFLLRSQNFLTLEDYVTQLFVDGLFGDQYQAALNFYLGQHQAYRKVLPRLLNMQHAWEE